MHTLKTYFITTRQHGGVLAVVASISAVILLSPMQAWADLLVASFDTNQVLRYDEMTGAFLGIFATDSVGEGPVSMTFGPDGNLYVGKISAIHRYDGRTGAFIDTFATGGDLRGATGLAFGSDGNLYVSSFGGLAPNSKVIRYDGDTGAYIDDFIPVGSGGLQGATSLIFGPDGNLYVTSRVTNQVLRYNGSTGAFLNIFASGGFNGPQDLVFGPDGNLFVLYDSPQQIDRFDGLTGEFLGTFAMGTWGTDEIELAFGPDRNLYVTSGFIGNSVLRFDGSTGQFIDEIVPAGSDGLSNATALLFFTPSGPIEVHLDIKPGSDNNPINPKSNGIIPVAILTTDTFDATTVDPLSVRFGPKEAQEAHGKGHIEDVNQDGEPDLVLHFSTQETGIACGDTSASLTGETGDGEPIQGSDTIKTVGCNN
jgi:outer membrane protein assembly factor BamB